MTTTGHLSEYALDRGGAEVEAHMAGCPACAARAADRRRLDVEFATEVLPRTLGRVRSRVVARRAARRRWWALGGGVAATAVAAVIVVLARPTPRPETAWEGIKGSASASAAALSVFVRRGNEVTELAPGQPVRPGDALRFVVRLDRPRFFELRARDAAGQERTLIPDGPAAIQVRPGQALPGGFVVDAAPGPERLTLLLGDRPFPVGRAAAGDLQVVRIDLRKEP